MDLGALNVAVIGAGIGGVAAAIALAQRGAHVRVYEQAPALGEVGAGLQISANGQVVLRALGVEPKGATVSTGTVFRDGASGWAVARLPAPTQNPTWYLHRADVLKALVARANAVGVQFDLGQAVAPGDIQADLIIAADGVKSQWRDYVDAPVQRHFSGHVAWRALVPVEEAPAHEASLSMGPGAHVVNYPLRAGAVMNIVAIEERDDWRTESWSERGDPAEFQARFAKFGGPLRDLIGQAGLVHIWALHARPVASQWCRDNAVLLGDAAHPTLPFMAQGACLALEDAWVLGAALAGAPNIASALQAYEGARKDRARRVVGLAKGNGRRFHMGWPFNWGAYVTLALGAGILARRLDWVYAYDATKALMPR